MKPKFLYHGSSKKIKGNLIPKQAKDLDKKNINNSLKGIYASDFIIEAIAMGVLKSQGVKGGSINRGKFNGIPAIDAVMYGGVPKQKYIYLYTLPLRTFKNIPRGSLQWVSREAVKPKKVERLLVKDYIHLIRKATKKEKENWTKNEKEN